MNLKALTSAILFASVPMTGAFAAAMDRSGQSISAFLQPGNYFEAGISVLDADVSEGDYLRQWLPELAHLDTKQIHAPHAKKYQPELAYPLPIVDLKQSRLHAIETFSAL